VEREDEGGWLGGHEAVNGCLVRGGDARRGITEVISIFSTVPTTGILGEGADEEEPSRAKPEKRKDEQGRSPS
jgi:hypothetical protein